MNIDGSGLRQVTTGLGYDGGAFFSPDSKQLIFRASRPKTEADILEYTDLLKQGLVQPTAMELFICDVDGKNLRQITKLGGANWAPLSSSFRKKSGLFIESPHEIKTSVQPFFYQCGWHWFGANHV